MSSYLAHFGLSPPFSFFLFSMRIIRQKKEMEGKESDRFFPPALLRLKCRKKVF